MAIQVPLRRLAGLALLAGLLVTLGSETAAVMAAEASCSSGSELSSPNCQLAAPPSLTDNAGPDLHFQDGFLDEGDRQNLIQYLDAHEPTNPLGVVLVPTPQTLAERFLGALRSLGAGSSNTGRFPQLSLSAFADGSGRLPGKVAGSGAKGCHVDFEVDKDFTVDNVLGPTEGCVGILYLSGEGEFLLVDEETGAETRQEIKPGRFISWRNTGNTHCVVTNSEQPRRFLGPVVLDKKQVGFIPVVDILAGPALTCSSSADCAEPNPACTDNLCCAPPGSAASRSSFCCPGSIFYYPSRKCCYLVGASASSASQCCTGIIVDNICAPPGDLTCVSKCKRAANNEYVDDKGKCGKLGFPRRKACEEVVAAEQSRHRAYCHGANLPFNC